MPSSIPLQHCKKNKTAKLPRETTVPTELVMHIKTTEMDLDVNIFHVSLLSYVALANNYDMFMEEN